MDFTGFAAVELFHAREAEHADHARRSSWLRKLRELDRRERAVSERPNLFRAIRPQSPRALTNAHSPWI